MIRTVICSYDVLEKCRAKFKNHKVEPDRHAPAGSYYWFGRDGKVRSSKAGSPDVWCIRNVTLDPTEARHYVRKTLKEPLV